MPLSNAFARKPMAIPGVRRANSGQAMIEFAIVVPVMMLILLGIVAFGAIWSHQLKLNNASREGARHGIVCGATDEFIRTIVRDRVKTLRHTQPDDPPDRLAISIDPPETPERLAGLLEGDPLTVTVRYEDYIAVPIWGVFTNPKRLVSVTTMRLEGCPPPDDDDAGGDDDDDAGDDDDDSGDHDCCEGKVSSLTLRYDGANPAQVRIVEKKTGAEIFAANLNPGAVFTFTGSGTGGSMGTDIYLYLDGTLHTSIHTSCSQPIGPGMAFGSFMILAGESVIGGPLC